ncbi:MAG: matrixin family metalloprotease [Armatimonadota bacterium]|nr:matrixin family metalloprotease [Armatimonadota bacterium]
MHSSIFTRALLGATAAAVASFTYTPASAQALPAMDCRVIGQFSVVFKAGTPEREIQDVLNKMRAHSLEGLDFQIGGRWSQTSYGGTGATGNPARLGFSYVPDGTFVPNEGLGSGASSLFARMNALFSGNTALWQDKVSRGFFRWGDLSGLDYTVTTDDGASFPNAPGAQNVRGDIRVAMITLTNPNVLAYNYFPNLGDMVMNRSYNWNNSSGDYRFLRNVIGHEHGHGIGLNHVIPINNTKLMEPFLSVQFDGPQSDDIQGGQFLYGDHYENNDTNATKTDLGSVTHGQAVEFLAIERNTDLDWYRIAIPPGNSLSLTVFPVGSTYQQGPEGGSVSTRNSLSVHDLRVTAYQQDGTTVITTMNANGIGLSETISNIPRPASGEIALKVDSITVSGDIQRYRMTFALTTANVTVLPDVLTPIRGILFGGNLASLQASDNNRLVYQPGIVFSPSQAPVVFEVEGDSPELTPTHLTFGIEAQMSTNVGHRTVEFYNYDTDLFEELASAAVGTTESLVLVHVMTDPGRFVDADGTVRARISYRVTGPVFSVPWQGGTDYIYWELTP